MYTVKFEKENISIYVNVQLDWDAQVSEITEAAQKHLTPILQIDPKTLTVKQLKFYPDEMTVEEKHELYLKLQELEKEQNGGRGVQSIKTVLRELRIAFNNFYSSEHDVFYDNCIHSARSAWEWDADKMRSYPELNRLMRQILDISTDEYMNEPLY